MRRIFAIAAGGAGLIAAVAIAGQSNPNAGQAAIRAEAQRASQRAAALERDARLSAQASERAALAAAALAARVQAGEAAISESDARLARLTQQRRALEIRIAREYGPSSQLLAGLQTYARRPALLTMIQPGSVTDAVHLRAVAAAVQPQIRARTGALRQALATSRQLEREATEVAARRVALRTALSERRRDLDVLAASERLKAQRATGAADREAERAFVLGEQSRDLPSLVRRLRAEPASRSVAPVTQGRPGPASYRLPVSAALAPADSGPQRTVTLLPQPAALAVAPSAGRVAFAGPYRGYGMIVIVEHPQGWTSLVTGLASVTVAVGQTVVAGSPIGQASARNPRIGVELRRDGQRVNPLDHLR